MAEAESDETRGREIRGLLRGALKAALGTSMDDGSPYVSLVMLACDQAARPLLLLSELAQHTANIHRSGQASLLVEASDRHGPPLAEARVTLQGTLAPVDETEVRRRYLARHADAAMYAGFRDFSFYRLEPAHAHLVAGFGRIAWVEAGAFLLDPPAHERIAAAEADIVGHMNADHQDALELIVGSVLRRSGQGATMTGVDPDGFDVRVEDALLRIPFAGLATTPVAVREELVRMTKQARAEQP